MAEAEVTEDLLLNGKIRVRQPRRGYRVNVDTLLLAATLPTFSAGARVVELGCGVGACLLAVAAQHDDVTFTGIERDPTYAALARQNVELNGQTDHITIIEADVLDPSVQFGVFDHVLFNPPYDAEGEGHAPSEGKRAANIADQAIDDWIKLWSNRMGAGANLTLIHRAHKLGEILSALEGRLGGAEIFPIRPTANAPASRIVVRAHKGSRAPLKLHAGLTLHPDDGAAKYTPDTEAILRGDAHIGFG
jgi:tRNA1(Val) A37 N6-methylase TrmN6